MLHGVGMGAPFSIPPAWSPGVRGLENSNFSVEKAASPLPLPGPVRG